MSSRNLMKKAKRFFEKWNCTVYVDDSRALMVKNNHRTRWSMLFVAPFNRVALDTFAASIGLKLEHFNTGNNFPHYEVTESMRDKAIFHGAVPVTSRRATVLVRKCQEYAESENRKVSGDHANSKSKADRIHIRRSPIQVVR